MSTSQQTSVRFVDLALQPPSIALRMPAAPAPAPAVELPWAPLPTSTVWGIDFHALTMEQTLDAMERWIRRRVPGFAITANLNYAMLCDRDPSLKQLTRAAAIVLCDGMPIYWRSLWNACPLPERVAGSDLIYRLAERCADRGFRMYFYGAAEGIAEKTVARLTERYPKLDVAGFQSPAFGRTQPSEVQASLDRIRNARPDVLLVALGQPKGEHWIEYHHRELGVPLCIQVGASFDFVAGAAKRAPVVFQKTGLEWLVRASRDPRRLVPRYAQNFLYLLKAMRRDMIDTLSAPQIAFNDSHRADAVDV